MGQQTSRQNCSCSCGAWERLASDTTESTGSPPASSIHRYVSAVTGRGSGGCGGGECSCRRRRWPLLQRRCRPACVCTAHRSASECVPAGAAVAAAGSAHERLRDDQLAAVLALGARPLPSEPYALVDIVRSGQVTGDPQQLLVCCLHTADLDPEDLEEHARARRALEIAQGVEVPPGVRPHFQVVCNNGVRAVFVRTPAPAAPLPALLPVTRVHTQADYIHCLVPDLKEITACCYYWGKMDRYEAERLLDNKPEGTFLLRDSAQEEHLFSVSFRKYGRSLHARIEHFNHKFSFDSHDPAVYCADTVTALIHHYKDPSCVMFFEPMLTAPLPRNFPFSLQQLARAVIVSNTTYDGVEALPLPARLRAYLKEYHYKQLVRVRRLDSLACLHHHDA